MTTATIDGSARRSTTQDRVVSQPVTLTRVVRSEWIKFRSLWSSWAVLGAAVLGMLVVGMVVAYNTRHLTGHQQSEDLVPSATLQGYLLGQLLIGALGVLFVSGEFSTGMIRSTFAAVPKRIPVLWAKLAVFSVISAVAMVVTSIVTFVSAQALIGHYRTGYSLSDPGVWRVVLGTGLYLMAAAVIGGMVAWIVRSTPGSLVAYFALMLVLPLFGHLFGSAGAHLAQFLPSQAAQAFITSTPDSPHLSSGVGMLVVAAWVAAGVILAIGSLRRRDA